MRSHPFVIPANAGMTGGASGNSGPHRRLPVAFLATALLLGGCGAASGLEPREGRSLPVAPVGARATPTPAELLTPTVQQRPQRSDELLRSSDERRTDEFDLPPHD